MAQTYTYSGKAINGSLSGPWGVIPFAGIAASGLIRIGIRMETAHANLQKGMDGSIAPSYVFGEEGRIEIEVFQTSTLQQLMTNAYNTQKTLADSGAAALLFSGTLFVQDTSTGASHTATGVAIDKYTDKNYGTQAQGTTWALVCANISNQIA